AKSERHTGAHALTVYGHDEDAGAVDRKSSVVARDDLRTVLDPRAQAVESHIEFARSERDANVRAAHFRMRLRHAIERLVRHEPVGEDAAVIRARSADRQHDEERHDQTLAHENSEMRIRRGRYT